MVYPMKNEPGGVSLIVLFIKNIDFFKKNVLSCLSIQILFSDRV